MITNNKGKLNTKFCSKKCLYNFYQNIYYVSINNRKVCYGLDSELNGFIKGQVGISNGAKTRTFRGLFKLRLSSKAIAVCNMMMLKMGRSSKANSVSKKI